MGAKLSAECVSEQVSAPIMPATLTACIHNSCWPFLPLTSKEKSMVLMFGSAVSFRDRLSSVAPFDKPLSNKIILLGFCKSKFWYKLTSKNALTSTVSPDFNESVPKSVPVRGVTVPNCISFGAGPGPSSIKSIEYSALPLFAKILLCPEKSPFKKPSKRLVKEPSSEMFELGIDW